MPDLLNQLQTLFVDVIYGSNQYEKIVVNFMGMVTRNLNFQ
jgi:hypothetical protein